MKKVKRLTEPYLFIDEYGNRHSLEAKIEGRTYRLSMQFPCTRDRKYIYETLRNYMIAYYENGHLEKISDNY